jgi:hypothetical protein
MPKHALANWCDARVVKGPQHATVHGRDEVAVVAADEFRRLEGERTARGRDTDTEPTRQRVPVRDVGQRVRDDARAR